MNAKKIAGIIMALGIIVGTGVFLILRSPVFKEETNISSNSPKKVTIYKSPTCGCCGQYVSYLEENGFQVDTIIDSDINPIKSKYKIDRDMESCHTAIIENYFIEGHVPIDAINKLLAERPDIDGISLPKMPLGSPGMPGSKQEPFKIYGIKDGKAEKFMNL